MLLLKLFTDEIIRALLWSHEEKCFMIFIVGVKLVLIEGKGQ